MRPYTVIIAFVFSHLLHADQVSFRADALQGIPSSQPLKGEQLLSYEKGRLILEITNIEEHSGSLRVALFAEKSQWLEEPLYRKIIPLSSENCANSDCFWALELPYSDYGVALYHDSNNSRSLDTNFLGIPSEPYGFSNNLTAAFGPPSWRKAAFSIDKPEVRHRIRLR